MAGMFGAVGATGADPLTQNDNPFLIGQTGNSVPPSVFRRHGNAEQGCNGGLGGMGITPPGAPSRSRNSSPRGSPQTTR